MLGCPHYTIEQIWEAAQLLEGRKIHTNTALWIWTPRAIKSLADRNGYTKIIEDAGAKIMTDSCSAMSRAVPPGMGDTFAFTAPRVKRKMPSCLPTKRPPSACPPPAWRTAT